MNTIKIQDTTFVVDKIVGWYIKHYRYLNIITMVGEYKFIYESETNLDSAVVYLKSAIESE